MRFMALWGSASGLFRARLSRQGWRYHLIFAASAAAASTVAGLLTLAALAQSNQPPSLAPKPLIIPLANRVPDANDQMEMRLDKMKRQNFNAANAERLKQLMKATEMMETMAMALKAEVDDTPSNALSANAVQKAENIEKLARIVKERMELTAAPN